MDTFVMLQDRTAPQPRRPLDLRLTLGAVGTLLIVLMALLMPRTPVDAQSQLSQASAATVAAPAPTVRA